MPCAPQALKAAGVTEVILAINYRPEVRAMASAALGRAPGRGAVVVTSRALPTAGTDKGSAIAGP